MCSIKQNLEQVTRQIDSAAQKCGRDASGVQLLAVSKTKPIDAIADAVGAGHRQFGENYVQEGVEKILHFREQSTPLEWHFIGPIQSNKTRPVAEHFDWVHSVDRSKVARRLSEQRPNDMPPLQVLIQINTSGESSKSGTQFEDVKALADEIDQLPNLELRGLMCIPQPEDDHDSQLAAFAPLSQLFEEMKASRPRFDTLSMGMSGDMDAAIASGSTMVRIGTAIFGARDYTNRQ
ncbi:YggS family pyridoxal phosphate enzyme [Enterovibrio norvegicus]|uniref:Pyridoxal phosphate homeostasis protein n=1 Tax=Enterovibrio norvegicus DSM 15893 TaxID=1121869 RepID=A0A1I5X8Y9_9GAMM|nr:YggS family pyridoxal phosphate-dependent enzyme [Enterovibrio norvegicus]OEE56490.1 YggS family pyridoxal phosphate enzyme [Enterovibrio norvegicus]OEF54118.1 YggS family pyridoxal phosphate enzyme [Enterovibrio norvegicus]PMI27332.1 YggS family pyridoxal phosphate enzyme [Enterovibrio norvegicus]PMI36527.1 YggS family pyridoxal phosphate enzyme [Enterovibrio norvegicus]PMN52765.1 YggS family pyridoxal phosphate enzyme [Enterovibrio norvegicus]